MAEKSKDTKALDYAKIRLKAAVVMLEEGNFPMPSDFQEYLVETLAKIEKITKG